MERIDELENLVRKLFDKLDQVRDILPFCHLSPDKNFQHQCIVINELKAVILQSIQIGNYRRAFLYLAALDRIINEIEKKRSEIQSRITQYILK